MTLPFQELKSGIPQGAYALASDARERFLAGQPIIGTSRDLATFKAANSDLAEKWYQDTIWWAGVQQERLSFVASSK